MEVAATCALQELRRLPRQGLQGLRLLQEHGQVWRSGTLEVRVRSSMLRLHPQLPISAYCAVCKLDRWQQVPQAGRKESKPPEDPPNLYECTVCLEYVHPQCVEKTRGLGRINPDLSNSWECAECFNDRDRINQQVLVEDQARAISDGRKVSDEGDKSSAMDVETSPHSATTPQPKATLPTAPTQTKTVMTPTPKLPTTASGLGNEGQGNNEKELDCAPPPYEKQAELLALKAANASLEDRMKKLEDQMRAISDGRKVSNEGFAMNVETPPQSATLQTAPIQTQPVIAPTASSAATQQYQKIQIIRSSDGKIKVGGLREGQQLLQMPDGKLQIFNNPNAGVTAMTPTPKLPTTASAKHSYKVLLNMIVRRGRGMGLYISTWPLCTQGRGTKFA